MKKLCKRILGIISVLILGYQQFSYADLIMDEPIDSFTTFSFLLGFIGVIILIISAISWFTLKATIKKQNMLGYDSEKLSTISTEEIEKKKNKIQRRFYVWGMILSIIGLIYLGLSDEISMITFFIPIILFVISFIVRLCKKKKISNIICAISVVLVCIIASGSIISDKMIENYNEQFLQYQRGGGWHSAFPSHVSDVEGLINQTIKNNKSGKKVTLIYKNMSYTSISELEQLLTKLNTNKIYSTVIKYDSNYEYIESISLSPYDIHLGLFLDEWEGEQKRGVTVKKLITTVMNKVANNEELKVNIIYTSETNQTTKFNVRKDNFQEISSLRSEISSAKGYKVEIENDLYECNIIITSND